MSKSVLRINEDISRELSVLLRGIKDPRVNQGMISVTAVETSGDLSQAKVFLSVFDLKSRDDFMKGIKSASGHLRFELGQALKLRHTPQLIFELDKSLEHGAKINRLLGELDIAPEDGSDDNTDEEVNVYE